MAELGNPKNTIEVLQKYQFHFAKKFGQNFLIDTHVLDKIVRAAEITPEDYVLEIGPGIGTGVIQKNMIEKVLEYNLPTVIDADGINNISEDERLKKKLHKNVVITPHLGEMSRFLNIPVEEIASNLIKYGREVNYKYNINCILKDARTVITTEQETFVNLSGNSGMATAGSGDVLTGIVAALIGIGVEFNNATVLAPYIHGLAGGKAMEYVSKTSMMATDIIEGIKILFKGMR